MELVFHNPVILILKKKKERERRVKEGKKEGERMTHLLVPEPGGLLSGKGSSLLG